MEHLRDGMDICAGIVCALVAANTVLVAINIIAAIVASICAIIWFGVRMYDRFIKKD